MTNEHAEFSQGICQDGAAILKDGEMMTIEEILTHLRFLHRLSNALRNALNMAEYISLHEGFSGSPQEYTEARAILAELDNMENGL